MLLGIPIRLAGAFSSGDTPVEASAPPPSATKMHQRLALTLTAAASSRREVD